MLFRFISTPKHSIENLYGLVAARLKCDIERLRAGVAVLEGRASEPTPSVMGSEECCQLPHPDGSEVESQPCILLHITSVAT